MNISFDKKYEKYIGRLVMNTSYNGEPIPERFGIIVETMGAFIDVYLFDIGEYKFLLLDEVSFL